jgi:hypothetical protein
MGFHDGHVAGLENVEGFRVKKVTMGTWPGATEYKLTVKGARISATPVGGGTTLTGGAVLGLVLHVEHKSGTAYWIRIADIGRTPYWARPRGVTYWATTYVLQWTASKVAPGTKQVWDNVCSNPVADDAENLGMNAFHSVVFEGDRISGEKKLVYAIDTDWFNIGCAGHALAKQHLTGHTEGAATAVAAFATTIDERTTALKMFAADYCGTGTAFTVAGTPLEWRDHRGWMNYSGPVKLESRWSPTGATCIEETRLDPIAHATLLADINAECGFTPPTCSALDGTADPNVFAGNHLVSAMP